MPAFTKLVTVATTPSLLIVAVLAVVMACGEGQASEPLTVREYARACGELVEFVQAEFELQDVTGYEDVRRFVNDAEDIWTELGKLSPPEELQSVHRLLVDQIEVTLLFFKGSDVSTAVDVFAEIDESMQREDVSEVEMARLEANFVAVVEKMEESRARFKEQAEALEEEAEQARSNLSPETLDILMAERCAYRSYWQLLRGADTIGKPL